MARGATPISPLEQRERVVPSFGQERMWFDNALEPDSSAYNVALGLHLRGELDAAALERALVQVIERHEVLRTTFLTTTEGLRGRVRGEAELRLVRVDLRGLPAGGRGDAVREHAVAERSAPFDLATGPLVRGKLLRVDERHHVLLLTIHHIASDGWSVGVLMSEVGANYAAALRGAPSPLPALRIQYADYAAWERERMSGPRLRAELDWWLARLDGAPRAMHLPSDGRQPSAPGLATANRRVELQPGVLQALTGLARGEGATLYVGLLAAIHLLLARYTGETDLVVGAPAANRLNVATHSLIGFFVNTLALRVDVSGRPSFREVLRRARSQAFTSFAHQELPFERLVEALRPERKLGKNPLFDVMFINIDSKAAPFTLPGLETAWLSHGTPTAPVELTFELVNLGDASAQDRGLVLSSRTDVFGPESVERMTRHLATLIESAVAHPDLPIQALPMLTAPDRAALAACRTPDANVPVDRCVHELVRAREELHPDRIAVRHGDHALTYGELGRRARRLARRLAQAGVGVGSVVGVCVERSPELLVALLGVLEAGAAYLPLDPGYPRDRLAFFLEDCDVRVIVGGDTAEQLAGSSRVALRLDDPARRAEGELRDPERATPSDAAYVIYTSGTTGVPKGVVIEHRSFANLLGSMGARPGLREDDVVAAITSVSFDIAALDLFLPLVTGARLEIIPREWMADAARIVALGATVMQATPTVWRALVDGGLRAPSLVAITGGEMLAEGLASELLARTAAVHDSYGPTETTVYSTTGRVRAHGIACVGRPIARTNLHVLDDDFGELPIGVPGVAWVGGAGVARGYHGRPALTADAFRPDPWADVPGARIYRTGDRATWLASGELRLLGRADDQIKIRGHRIEPGEVESSLTEHPAVGQTAVVVTKQADAAEPRLVAYFVAHGPAPESGELRAFLRDRLPDAFVPVAFIAIPEMPRSPAGKIDRRALAARKVDVAERSLLAPRDDVERTLHAIWTDLLGVAVGVEDDFFDSGGHSLIAVRLLARIEEDFGRALPLTVFFEAGTIAEMAELLGAPASAR